GCGECVTVCPTKAISMQPQESQAAQQAVFDYCAANINLKPETAAEPINVKNSQFRQPLLEFSGSCAGCAETSYGRLITQLFGEHMFISNATGCSSIWGGPAATSPYTVNNVSGQGPAWANSLFEDNAEHGFGMYLGQKAIRENTVKLLDEMAASDKASDAFKAALDAYKASYKNTLKNTADTKALLAEVEKAAAEGCETAAKVLENKQYLAKKSIWI